MDFEIRNIENFLFSVNTNNIYTLIKTIQDFSID